MRNLHAFIALAMILAAQGCTQKEATYQTLRSVATAVDGARKVYADALNLNMVTPEKEAEIDKLIADYQTQMNTAITLAQFDYSTAPPAELAALASRLTTEILILAGKIERNQPTGGIR